MLIKFYSTPATITTKFEMRMGRNSNIKLSKDKTTLEMAPAFPFTDLKNIQNMAMYKTLNIRGVVVSVANARLGRPIHRGDRFNDIQDVTIGNEDAHVMVTLFDTFAEAFARNWNTMAQGKKLMVTITSASVRSVDGTKKHITTINSTSVTYNTIT